MKREFPQSLRRLKFWEREYGLTALLVMVVLQLFVLTPLAGSGVISSESLLIFLAVLTVTGVAAISGRPIVVIIVVLLACSGIALDWVAHYSGDQSLRVFDNLLRLAFVLMLAVIVTFQVFRPGSVTVHRVQGAICVYLLVGLAWAYAYGTVDLLNHAAFRIAAYDASGTGRVGMFRYFSFVTLTTLGYGDILPISPVARALATSEALFGQLYPAVMIARLISLEILDRRRA